MNQRKPSKNSRNGRGKEPQVLNVMIGSTPGAIRIRRKHILAVGFWIGLLVFGTITVLVMLRHAFMRAFVDSEHFTLTRIELVTNGKLERSQLLAATGVREGANLLKLDLAKIESQARAMPQVESAVVERILPDSLKIVLHERVPVAWVSCLPSGWRARTATNGLLVGRDGHLFRCESLSPDMLGLPVLELREATDLEPGRALPAGPPTAALDLLANLATNFDADLPTLRVLAVRTGYSLEATLANGEIAWLSPESPIEDFQRLAAIIEDFQRRDQKVAFANLLPRKNIAIRLASPTPVEVKPARAVPEPQETKTPVNAKRSSPELRAILNRR